MGTFSEIDGEPPKCTCFLTEMQSFDIPQLSVGKVVLAYHLAHPEQVMAPDVRVKIRAALLALIDEGLISIAEDDWDDHRTACLPRSVLLLSPGE